MRGSDYPLPWANNQMGALFLTAKDGYAFAAAAGDKTAIDAPAGSAGRAWIRLHRSGFAGALHRVGEGHQAGYEALDTVNNVDIAPTAATLLGLQMKNVDGRVLSDILELPQGRAVKFIQSNQPVLR